MDNKKIIVIVIVTLISLICIGYKDINKEDNFNKELSITINTNGGIPYKWEYEIENPEIVEYVKKEDIPENPNLEGGRVQINYIFKGLKKGITTIKFKEIYIIDNSIEEEKTYKVKVDKNKNISLIEIK